MGLKRHPLDRGDIKCCEVVDGEPRSFFEEGVLLNEEEKKPLFLGKRRSRLQGLFPVQNGGSCLLGCLGRNVLQTMMMIIIILKALFLVLL